MYKVLVLVLSIPMLVAALNFRGCTDNSPAPTKVEIDGCTVTPCQLIRNEYLEVISWFQNQTPTIELQLNVNFRSILGSGTFELSDKEADACQSLLVGTCPLLSNDSVVHKFRSFNLPALPAGFPITLEIYLRNDQNSVVSCYEIDFLII